MRRFAAICALGALAGCTNAPGGDAPVRMGMPPVGLASTAIWLEDRESLTARPVRAQDIPTAQIRDVVAGGAPVAVAPQQTAATPTDVSDVANRILFSTSNGGAATVVFVEACLKTAAAPNQAATVLQRLGFDERRGRRGQTEFRSDFAVATLSPDTRGGGFGQCTVTPTASSFAQVVPEFRRQIEASGVPVERLPNEEAYVIGDTAAVALVSRSGGAMTRTQPGVFRQ